MHERLILEIIIVHCLLWSRIAWDSFSRDLTIIFPLLVITLPVAKSARHLIMLCKFKHYLIIIIYLFRNWFLIRSINTGKFAFASPNVRLASLLNLAAEIPKHFMLQNFILSLLIKLSHCKFPQSIMSIAC